jgi:Protein of unknown function (DUF3828)
MYKEAKPIFLLAALLATFSFAPATNATADDSASCRAFVQKFYDWYVAKSNAPTSVSSTLETALKARSGDFSPELCKRIKEDNAAAAKSPGEIVGLDFDPILNTQESATPYKADKVSVKGSSFLIDVYSIEGGKKSAQPVVQPELSHSNGAWQFVNFHYKVDKKDDDLLNILKALRQERQPKAKKSK